MFKERGSFVRAMEFWLRMRTPVRPYCKMENGKLLTGTASAHLTRSGVGYNRLLRMRRRIAKE